jgi:hypothetical protein
LNYNIQMGMDNNRNPKYISDYVYWDSINEEDLIKNIIHLNTNEYFLENFIDQLNGDGYINKNEISSVKFSEKKNRVIFNLSHPITFTDYTKTDKITSEFVYVNCSSEGEFETYSEKIKTALEGK